MLSVFLFGLLVIRLFLPFFLFGMFIYRVSNDRQGKVRLCSWIVDPSAAFPFPPYGFIVSVPWFVSFVLFSVVPGS